LKATAVALADPPTDRPLASVSTQSELADQFLIDVLKFVSAFIRPRADAEDVTAETFRSALTSLRLPKSHQEARAWLLKVARRRIADHIRQRKRRPDSTRPDEPQQDQRNSLATGASVRAILAEMPADQSAALVMKYSLGMTSEEIGQSIGRSVAATNSLLQRGRAIFQDRAQSLLEDLP
jgi:RNA polymerase sigma-70 factor (ECF subfamily)